MSKKQTKPAKSGKPAKGNPAPVNPAPEHAEFTGQPDAATVSSGQSPEPSAPAHSPEAPARSTKHMDLTLKHKATKADGTPARATDRLVIFDYTDRKGSVQFLRTLFGDQIPEQITISGEFTEPKAPRVPETAEERKARLAALPKPTIEQQIAKAEERAKKLREKLDAQQKKAEAGQPVGASA